MTMLIEGLVLHGAQTRRGWVEVVSDRIADAGGGAPPRTPEVRHDGIVARGLVDLEPRVVLVSDAGPPAAAPPGRYTLAGVEVTADAEGRIVAPPGVLAGSALTLDEAVRRWRAFSGVALPTALAAASARPARLAGLAPSLSPGAPADLVLLDEERRSGADAAPRPVA